MGINKKSNMSYEKYLRAGLEIISPQLSIRTYKLAPKDEYPMFKRGVDLRVRIYWKKESMYEFIVDKSFFHQSNANKYDREYMREWADIKLTMFNNAVQEGKEKIKKKPKKKRTPKKKVQMGSTQKSFDNFKQGVL